MSLFSLFSTIFTFDGQETAMSVFPHFVHLYAEPCRRHLARVFFTTSISVVTFDVFHTFFPFDGEDTL